MKHRLLARALVGLLPLACGPAAAFQAPAPVAPEAPAGEQPRAAGTEVPVPKRSKFVQPEYPAQALAQGLRGIVILALTIDTSGKVSAVDVVRSLPPFDEAAAAAARQWEYEVTKVAGRAVPVRLTVPITFALKLPEMTRDPAIPELRQGVAPPFPIDARADGPATVTADVTIDPSGQIVEAEIKSGSTPWTEALLLALRTWRFTPIGGDHMASFQVRADFVPGARGAQRVDLKLSGMRQGEVATARVEQAPEPSAPAAPANEPAAGDPAPAAGDPAPPTGDPEAPAPGDPAPTAPDPAPAAPAEPTPSAEAPPATTPTAQAPAPAPEQASPTPPPAAPDRAAAEPSTSAPAPAPASAAPPAAAPATTAPATTAPAGAPAQAQPGAAAGPPPAVEVIPAAPAPPPPPPEPGVSAIQGVLLGPGVPDLSKGRRPVSPPLARMNSVNGNVEVRFVVEASGSSSVRDVTGPELLKEAARQTVASWMFRRTTPERMPLVAVFSYIGDGASASVKVAE